MFDNAALPADSVLYVSELLHVLIFKDVIFDMVVLTAQSECAASYNFVFGDVGLIYSSSRAGDDVLEGHIMVEVKEGRIQALPASCGQLYTRAVFTELVYGLSPADNGTSRNPIETNYSRIVLYHFKA